MFSDFDEWLIIGIYTFHGVYKSYLYIYMYVYGLYTMSGKRSACV